MSHTWESDLELAHRLADDAARVAMSFFRGAFDRWSKGDGSLVTQADQTVERALRDRLARERPNDAILGEEHGATGSGPRRWILDPIDGTVDFASGRPDWGALIALESDGRVVVGVCDQPAHRRRFWAASGGGAFWTDPVGARQSLTVSRLADVATARSYVPPPQWQRDERARRIAETLSAASRSAPAVNHPALQVAAGDSEFAAFLSGGPWDLAAPALIVEEAGGRFSDLVGAHDLFSGAAVFSNGRLHDAVLQVIARA